MVVESGTTDGTRYSPNEKEVIDEMDKSGMANDLGVGRLFFCWKRSVIRVVYGEVVVFLAVYATISAVYRNFLNDNQKKLFEESKAFFQTFTHQLPLPFLLGFYTTIVARRWWQQYLTIPWPDRLMLAVQMYVTGNDEKTKLFRRVLLRRALLMMVLLLRSTSVAVKRTYPTLHCLVKAGLMTRTEKRCYESTKSAAANLFWIPATWFVSTLNEAANDGTLTDESGIKLIMEEFLDFRARCGAIWSYNWVNIPIIYTQVCTLATYSYFIACLVSRQYTGPGDWSSVESVDIYIPIGTVVEMLCYIGLLKLAEEIKNPFGDDNEEDFDLNFIITRHLRTVRIGLEDLEGKSPPYTDTPIVTSLL